MVNFTVGISLDEKTIRRLSDFARKHYVSRSKVVQWALDEYFAAHDRAVKRQKKNEEK